MMRAQQRYQLICPHGHTRVHFIAVENEYHCETCQQNHADPNIDADIDYRYQPHQITHTQ